MRISGTEHEVKVRSPWAVALLPIITLGIYHLVWWYKVNREARDFDNRIKADPLMSLLAITIGGFIIIPPFVSIYNTGNRIKEMQRVSGIQGTCNPWVGILLVFFAGLHALYYQMELNRVWDRYDNPPEGTRVPLNY
jgi:fatty acid desaturase